MLNKLINIRLIDIKKLILASLIILCGCQPEQTTWPESKLAKRSTPGQVVFEVLSNNLTRQGECGPERGSLLEKKKDVFISKFDALLNALSDGNKEENFQLLADYIKKNESTKKILKASDYIKQKSTDIAKIQLKNLKEILSADNRAVERLILQIIHSKDLDKLLADLADRAGPQLEIGPLVSHIETIINNNFVHMSVHDFLKKLLELFVDSSELHKIGEKIINLTEKLSDPAAKKALLELKNILSKVYPDLSFEHIDTWMEQVKKLPTPGDFGVWVAKYLLSSPNLLSPAAVKFAVNIAATTTNSIPAFLPDLLDRITADENNFKILWQNLYILYKAGIIDDITDLISELKKFKQLTQPDIDIITDLISDPKINLISELKKFKQLTQLEIDIIAGLMSDQTINLISELKKFKQLTQPNIDIIAGLRSDHTINLISELKKFKQLTQPEIDIIAGLISDHTINLIYELKKFKQLTQPEIDIIAGLMSDPKEPEMLPKTEYFKRLKHIISYAKKLLPADQPIVEAPAVAVAQVILQILATTKHNECRLPTENTSISSTIKSWVESLVAFMRDSEKGLLHILSIIRYNL